ncbi:hypothetical protein MNBD_NITROSPINAE02-433 [hydrothermal vent metagenome]|uniref:Type IV fimbrial biogenesis protein PilV n=1 Tax=hydrothermal vent metagenome TaxID=652676 RepID=A0A3B1DB51_9ZZZZ
MRKIKPAGVAIAGEKAGFTLIEVLVTVVVLAVGVLGFTALQVSSMSSSLLTRSLDSCVNVAFDSLDRIRSNIGDANYGNDFMVDPASGCPGDGSDADAICNAMIDMQFDNATLSVSFEKDTPLNLIDTVTVAIAYTYKGLNKTCTVMDIMNRK